MLIIRCELFDSNGSDQRVVIEFYHVKLTHLHEIFTILNVNSHTLKIVSLRR